MHWCKTRVLVFLFIQLCWSYEREPLSLRGVVYPSPTPLPLPTATPTSTLTPSPSPSNSPSPSSTLSPSPTITSSPTITITPSMTSTPTPSLTPTPTPTPFTVLTPSPIVTLPPSPTPSENPTPTVTITATTTSLPTPTPQATPIPSPTSMVSSFTITTSTSEQDTNNNFFPVTGGSVDITIVDQDGNDVAIIIADSDVLTGNVSVSISNSSDSNIVSDIITIDLDDNNSNQPNGDVELCFYVEKQDVRKLKLASFDPKDDCWQEEDNVKERETRTNRITGKKEVLVCGEVDHFTDFSILLDNEDGGADVCLDEAVEDSIAILLIVLASVAATLSVFSVGFIIATYLWNERFRHLIQGTEATRVEQLRKINKMIEIEEEEDEEDDKLSNRIINQSVPPV